MVAIEKETPHRVVIASGIEVPDLETLGNVKPRGKITIVGHLDVEHVGRVGRGNGGGVPRTAGTRWQEIRVTWISLMIRVLCSPDHTLDHMFIVVFFDTAKQRDNKKKLLLEI